MTKMIEVEGLSAFRAAGFWGAKRQVLSSVSFTVGAGHVCGLVGPNGAGKSTTIRFLVGVAKPLVGKVLIGGSSPLQASTRDRIGYAPELPSLPPTLTARELCQLHSRLRRVDLDPGLLERVGLADRGNEPIHRFSKGMVQRLTLALSLIGQPELLVLDEPMSGLDPVGRELVRNLIRAEHARGATIILSSHVLSDVAKLCDQVLVMRSGALILDERVQLGAVAEYDVVFDGPADSATRRVPPDGLAAALAQGQGSGLTLLSVEPVRSSLEARVLNALAAP